MKQMSELNQPTVFSKRHTWQRVCSFVDYPVALGLALVPILQHYIGFFDNAGTSLLIVIFPYLFVRFLQSLKSFKLANLRFAIVLILFFLYKLADHGFSFSEFGQVGLMCFFLLCICQNLIDTKRLTRIAVFIAAFAGVLILIQYVCYYVLGFHVQMVPVYLLLDESEAWIRLAQTGKIGVTGEVLRFYRPSAFFLEPSHLFIYSFPCLFISLFNWKGEKWNKLCSFLITVALVLCTSGMGIVCAICAWGLFLAARGEDGSFRLKNICNRKNWLSILTLLLVGLFVTAIVPFLRDTVMRIFFAQSGSNAIEGRTQVALLYMRRMTPIQRIIGVADTTGGVQFNMSGFFATAYKYGILGILLSYEIYVKGLFKLNLPYFWFTAVLLVISFFSAHTHGTFYMLYYVLLLREGHLVSGEPWLSGLFPKLKKRPELRLPRAVTVIFIFMAIMADVALFVLTGQFSALKNWGEKTPMLTLVDEGGGIHFKSDILPLVKRTGVPVTSAVTVSRISSGIRWMTWKDLEEISAAGAEVISHGFNRYYYAELSEMGDISIERDFEKAKKKLLDKGFSGGEFFAYTATLNNMERVATDASFIYKCAIHIGDDSINAWYTDPINLSSFRLDYEAENGKEDWSPENLAAIIDTIAEEGGWGIWRFRSSASDWCQRVKLDSKGNVVLDLEGNPIPSYDRMGRPVLDAVGLFPTMGTEVYIPMLEDAIAYAREKGIKIVTVQEGYECYYG